MKCAIYHQSDGSLAVCVPVPWQRLVSEVLNQSQEWEVLDPPRTMESAGIRSQEAYEEALPATRFAETEDEFVLRIAQKDVPQEYHADMKIIDSADIPEDRHFRDAWKHDGTRPVVDMPKAREIHMARIRAQRNVKLRSLDEETMAAMTKPQAERDEIETRKQVLRDLPPTVDLEAAATPEELKSIWPSELT